MPQYHFSMNDGHTSTQDIEGSEHDNEDAARRMVFANAREMLSDSDRGGLCRRHWRTNVTDGAGNRLFSIPFAHALVPDFLPPPANGGQSHASA